MTLVLGNLDTTKSIAYNFEKDNGYQQTIVSTAGVVMPLQDPNSLSIASPLYKHNSGFTFSAERDMGSMMRLTLFKPDSDVRALATADKMVSLTNFRSH